MDKGGLIKKYFDEGLVLYGVGKFEEAVKIWREILKLDPGNSQAVDYIQSAGFSPEQTDNPIEEARRLLDQKQPEEAYGIASNILRKDPSDTEAKILLEVIEKSMAELYKNIFSDTKKIPSLEVDFSELLNYPLEKNDGFLLSLIDGKTSVQDIIDVSGMQEFDVLRIVSKLQRLEIISIK